MESESVPPLPVNVLIPSTPSSVHSTSDASPPTLNVSLPADPLTTSDVVLGSEDSESVFASLVSMFHVIASAVP